MEKTQRAVEELVKANEYILEPVAKQYQGRGLSVEELIEEGKKGLVIAAWKFDETRGIAFPAYAVWWVRQYMLQAICKKSPIVRD